ncbi:MAG: hypothetical protein QM724_04610 [Flavobacteriales bacterium]
MSVPYAANAQDDIPQDPMVSRPWPADTGGVVSTGDSIRLSWAHAVEDARSYGLTDLIGLVYDPLWATEKSRPMDVRVTLHITATSNPDPGARRRGGDSDSLVVAVLQVGIRPQAEQDARLSGELQGRDADVLMLTGAHRLALTVASIEVDTGSGYAAVPDLPRSLRIETSIAWARVAEGIDLSEPPSGLTATRILCGGLVPPGTPESLAEALTKEIRFSWSTLAGMIEYQLEWIWVDDYNTAGVPWTSTPPMGTFSYDLAHNSTRITTTGTRYQIPLLYDHGYIIYRLRGVARDPGDPTVPVMTAWTGAAPSGDVRQAIDDGYAIRIVGHQLSKNWQITSSFAEEGKRKEVVTYADGTSRARQVVTRNNSLRIPIIGETVYDVTGRPAMQIMPVPMVRGGCNDPSSIEGQAWAPIDYRPHFNMRVGENGESEDITAADLIALDDGCNIAAPMLHDTSGAERYYSSAFGDDLSPLIPAPPFLPKAGGYPYSQTQYTPDNTGRIRAQGGVGAQLQLNAHATEHFYGKPQQIELDRLFGSEAGYAEHYQKNVDVDPNGQVSITYVDLAGHTVATALSCAPDNGLVPVGNAADTLTSDFFGGRPSTDPSLGQARSPGPELFFTDHFAVPCDGPYSFNYAVTPLILRDDCWGSEGSPLCAHCAYQLKVDLVNTCGDTVFTVGALPGQVQLNDTAVMFACTDTVLENIALPQNVWLARGEYTLTKRLTVRKDVRDFYVNAFLDPRNNQCMRSEGTILDSLMWSVNANDCHLTCEDCYNALPPRDEFIGSGQGTAADYRALLAQCDRLCADPSWCEAAYSNMLVDVSRQGQYATYTNNDEQHHIASDRTSVFYSGPGNSVLGIPYFNSTGSDAHRHADPSKPLWRQPLLLQDSTWIAQYLTDEGERYRVRLIPLEAGGYEPPVVSGAEVDTDEVTGDIYTYPEFLADLHDFIENWQSGFERSLVRFHPEYCYYENCRSYGVRTDPEDRRSSSDGYDNILRHAVTYEDALDQDHQFLLDDPPGGAVEPQFLTQDPFLLDPANMPYAQELIDTYNAYLSIGGHTYTMAQAAAVFARCNGDFSAAAGGGWCQSFGDTDPVDHHGVHRNALQMQQIHDNEWATLRGFYMAKKYAVQKRRADAFVSSCNCAGVNYCIGEEHTRTWWSKTHAPFAYTPYTWSWYSFDSYASWYADYMANWSAQLGHQPCQLCNDGNYQWFDDKVRRVADPDQMPGSNMSAQDAAYQNFLQTGQCPVATAWQNLFQELAMQGAFPDSSGIDLQGSTGWQAIQLALNDFHASDIPPATASISRSGDTVTLSITSGTEVCEVTLETPSDTAFRWTELSYVAQLNAGAGGDFTLGVYYRHREVDRVAYIQGHMCNAYALAPCNFPRHCEPNDLALQLEGLLNMLAQDGTLAATTAQALSGNTYPNGPSPDIQSAIGPAITSRFASGYHLTWSFDPTDPIGPTWHLVDSSDPSLEYRLNRLTVTPADHPVAYYLERAALIRSLNSDNENYFTAELVDSSGGVLCTLHGQFWWFMHRFIEIANPLPLGDCGLPTPLDCMSAADQIYPQLLHTLTDVLLWNDNGFAHVDLWTSPHMTASLAALLCPTCDRTGMPDAGLGNGLVTEIDPETKTLHFGECISVELNTTTIYGLFNGIGPATLLDRSEVGDAYHGFQADLFLGGVPAGQVTVHAPCIDLLSCTPCPVDTMVPSSQQRHGLRIAGSDSTWRMPENTTRALFSMDTECQFFYEIWLAAVARYDTSDYFDMHPSLSIDEGISSYEDLEALGCCDHLGDYLEYLQNYLNWSEWWRTPLPDIVSLVDFCGNTDKCCLWYDLLIQEMGRYFVNRGWMSWLEPDPVAAVIQLGVDSLGLSFTSCEEMIQGRYCDCVKDYVSYLAPFAYNYNIEFYLNDPDKFTSFCKTGCIFQYAQIIGTDSLFRHSSYYQEVGCSPEIPSYAYVKAQGLCSCVQDYRYYLTSYIGWDTSMAQLPCPVELGAFCADQQDTACATAYARYLQVIITMQQVVNDHNRLHGTHYAFIVPSSEFFISAHLCYCVDGYIARLKYLFRDRVPAAIDIENVLDLMNKESTWSIAAYCDAPEPCGPAPLQPVTPDIPFSEPDPCITDLLAGVRLNAHSLYLQQVDTLTREITARYDSTCLRSLEHFAMTFPSNEHHYTLYYYDRAGNLVRTVPPEGVQPLAITSTSDPLDISIQHDRASGQHQEYTAHRMVSDQFFNSLGKPTRTSMPDRDNMAVWGTGLPIGLPPWLRITGSTFLPGGRGYLSGYRDMGSYLRGYVYGTADGGGTWTRSPGLVANTLRAVHYPSSTVGFAVGDRGSLLRTNDGGSTWDLLPNTLLASVRPARDVCFNTTSNGLVVGLGGLVAYTSNAGTTMVVDSVTGGVDLYGVGHDGTGFVACGANSAGSGFLLQVPNTGGTGLMNAFGSTAADLRCSSRLTTGTLFVGGAHGVLLKSTLGGEEWTTVPTSTTDAFMAVHFATASFGVAIMDSSGVGVLRATTDGGHSWTPAGSAAYRLNTFAPVQGASDELVAVGRNGLVLRLLLGWGNVGIEPVAGAPADLDIRSVWAGRDGDAERCIISGAVAGVGDGRLRWNRDIRTGVIWESSGVVLPVGSHARSIVCNSAPDHNVYGLAVTQAGSRVDGWWDFSAASVATDFSTPTAPGTYDRLARSGTSDAAVWSTADATFLYLPLISYPLPAPSSPWGVMPSGLPATDGAIPLSSNRMVLSGPHGALVMKDPAGWQDVGKYVRPLPLYAMSKDGQYAAAAQGTLYRRNGGSWQAIPTPEVHDMRGIYKAASDELVLVGDSGACFRIDPALPESSFQRIALPEHRDLHAVVAQGTGLTIGADGGTIYHTTDRTVAVPAFTTLPFNGGDVNGLAPNGSEVVAVGGGAMVHRLVGTTRLVVNDVFTPGLNAIQASAEGDVYTVGDALVMRRSTDGGQHWQEVLRSKSTNLPPLKGVCTSGGSGWAVGNSRVYNFTGTACTLVNDPAFSGINLFETVACTASGAVVLGGVSMSGPGRYFVRNVGATSFTACAGPSTYSAFHAAWAFPPYHGEEHVLLGCDGYTLLVRFASGVHTTDVVTPAAYGPFPPIRGFWFHDQTHGYAVGENGQFLRTTPSTTVDHSVFAWDTAYHSLDDGLRGQTDIYSMNVTTIGFSDRFHGFMGGNYLSGVDTLTGYARTVRDEGGLYSQRYWYDALGRIILSQNTKQAQLTPPRFSYTLYDELGRVYESGEVDDDGPVPFKKLAGMTVGGQRQAQVLDPEVVKAWILTPAYLWPASDPHMQRYEVTHTWYDAPITGFAPYLPVGFTQRNLRLRVAATAFYERVMGPVEDWPWDWTHATHYSYDIHGNVDDMVQHHTQMMFDGGDGRLGFKRIQYNYDLISGKVRQVNYQKGKLDAMCHRYSYDADDRLTKVETSQDGVNLWHTDGEYFYYPHGPLQRLELGRNKVQGVDYAYTLQGWLKGINGDQLKPQNDMGVDGGPGTPGPGYPPHGLVGRDVFSLSLGYYGDEDYEAIRTARWSNSSYHRPFAPIGTSGTLHDEYHPLYNGNIAHMVTNLYDEAGGYDQPPLAQVYEYDQLNRLQNSRGLQDYGGMMNYYNTWDGYDESYLTDRYRSLYRYDANGNIDTAARFDTYGSLYDGLLYRYHSNGGYRVSNRLYDLDDVADPGDYFGENDLPYRVGTFDNTSGGVNANNNYRYDVLGNLVRDESGGLANIEWTATGKVKQVQHLAGSGLADLTFGYGADGQRIDEAGGGSGPDRWRLPGALCSRCAGEHHGDLPVHEPLGHGCEPAGDGAPDLRERAAGGVHLSVGSVWHGGMGSDPHDTGLRCVQALRTEGPPGERGGGGVRKPAARPPPQCGRDADPGIRALRRAAARARVPESAGHSAHAATAEGDAGGDRVQQRSHHGDHQWGMRIRGAVREQLLDVPVGHERGHPRVDRGRQRGELQHQRGMRGRSGHRRRSHPVQERAHVEQCAGGNADRAVQRSGQLLRVHAERKRERWGILHQREQHHVAGADHGEWSHTEHQRLVRILWEQLRSHHQHHMERGNVVGERRRCDPGALPGLPGAGGCGLLPRCGLR